MEIASFVITTIFGILSIILGISGILVSLHCWKHNYEDIKYIKKQNKFIQELNAINFDEEYAFSTLLNIIARAHNENIDISKYFNVRENKTEHQVTKNDIMSAMYNLYHNTKDINNETNPRNQTENN